MANPQADAFAFKMKRQEEIVHDTIVWISGATEGIGLGLARNQPYPNARIVNLSRRQHLDYETVRFDLAEPATWDAVVAHFRNELRDFKGTRAIFIHNSTWAGARDLSVK